MFRGYINITIGPPSDRVRRGGHEMTKLDPLEYSTNGLRFLNELHTKAV